MAERFTYVPPTLQRYRTPSDLLADTADTLRSVSAGQREAVALWQGRVLDVSLAEFTKLHVPRQVAGPLHFNVPLAERLSLLAAIAAEGEFILAQVHTHPERAFHSDADDRLAITKHLGAISIVVPYFAAGWTGDLSATAIFTCVGGDCWRELSTAEVRAIFEVV